MNVILIISDTLRYDYLGVYGNEWIRTPHIDALAKESIIFDRAYAASFPTIPHRHDLYTGKYTFVYSDWEPLPKDETILPQLLRQSGCATYLIADTPWPISNGYNRGFDGWLWIRGQETDNYMTSPSRVKLPCDPRKLRGGETAVTQYLRNVSLRRFESDYFVAQTINNAIKWLELNYDQHDKFFLLVDTFDPHEPWDPPKYYVDLYDPGYKGEEIIYPAYRPSSYLSFDEVKHCKALYAGEVTLVDRWIGAFIEKIKNLGLFDKTAIILTSDHGFYFGEHGFMGKMVFVPMAFGYYPLYEEIIRIPLIMHLPNVKGGKRCKFFVQPQDLAATIIELLEAKAPTEMHGRSLIPLIKGEEVSWRDFVISAPGFPGILAGGPVSGQRITMTTDRWAFIYAGQVEEMLKDYPGRRINFDNYERITGKVKNELYDLSKDPTQENNLIDERKDVAMQLHSKIVEFLRQARTPEKYLKYYTNLE